MASGTKSQDKPNKKDDFSDKMKDALVVSNEFAIALSKNHRSMQKIIAENSGSSLLVMMEALMKLSGLRATLSEIKLPSTAFQQNPFHTYEQGNLQEQPQSKIELKPSPNDKKVNDAEKYKKIDSDSSQKIHYSVDKKINDDRTRKKIDTSSQKELPNAKKEAHKIINDNEKSKKSDMNDFNKQEQTPAITTKPVSMTDAGDQSPVTTKTPVSTKSCTAKSVCDAQKSSKGIIIEPDIENKQLCNNYDLKELHKYYSALVRSLPNDVSRSIQRLLHVLSDEEIASILNNKNPITCNQALIDCLITRVENKASILDFCEHLWSIKNSPPELHKILERLRKDVIFSLQDNREAIAKNPAAIPSPDVPFSRQDVRKTIAKVPTTATPADVPFSRQDVRKTITKVPTAATPSDVTFGQQDVRKTITKTTPAKPEKKPSIKAFDHHYNHMMIVDPRYVKDKFIKSRFFPNGDPLAGNATYLPNDVQMGRMLQIIRNLIALNEDDVFIQLVGVFHSEAMYAALGDKLMETYRHFGGDAALEANENKVMEAGQSCIMSDAELEKKLKWHMNQLQKGLLYQPPPPLPPNYIPRVTLLTDITEALMNTKVDETTSTTVTLLGFGGFGKSALATGLCHQPEIQRYFLDGVLWIKLGPKPPDTTMMLHKIYNQLTNESLHQISQQTNISIEDQLLGYVFNNLKRLLVIIDNVWSAEDALIYVTILSSCKIVLTTRKNDISVHIPTKKTIKIEEMSMEESKILLTFGAVDPQRLKFLKSGILENLAQDLHKWPLLLNLARIQLHSQIKLQTPLEQAVLKVHKVLYDEGLTAFDKTTISKDNAVKACVNATLALLTEKELSNLKILVLYAGTGITVPKSSLRFYWRDSDVDNNLEKLSSCGLVTIGRMSLPPSICTLSCVEMHAVITQYLMDSMDYGTYKQIYENMGISAVKLMDWSSSPEMLDDLFFGLENKVDFEALESDEKKMMIFQSQLVTGSMDNLGIPISIQRVIILTKAILQGVSETLELFLKQFKNHPQILSLLTKFKNENTMQSEKAYKHFRKAYKKIKSFLKLDNYNGTMNAIKEYIQDLPIQSLANNFSTLVEELKKNCKEDNASVSFIEENLPIDHKDAGDYLLTEWMSGFELQMKLRFALNKKTVTMEEQFDIIMDNCLSYLNWFHKSLTKGNPKLLHKLKSFNPEDKDVKASFDALAEAFSNMFKRDPALKTHMAKFFDICEHLPIRDFVLAMLRRYAQTTPSTLPSVNY